MRIQLNRLFATVVASLMLISFVSSMALAQATKVQGTITQCTKDKITIRAGDKDFELSLDGKNTVVSGRIAVDKQATVWYKKGPNGDLWATRISVPVKSTGNVNANAGDANNGKVQGTITSIASDRIIVRSTNEKEYKFMLDGKRTTTLGKPEVDKTATIWYKKFKGNLWATKVQVNK